MNLELAGPNEFGAGGCRALERGEASTRDQLWRPASKVASRRASNQDLNSSGFGDRRTNVFSFETRQGKELRENVPVCFQARRTSPALKRDRAKTSKLFPGLLLNAVNEASFQTRRSKTAAQDVTNWLLHVT